MTGRRAPDRATRATLRAAARPELAATSEAASVWRRQGSTVGAFRSVSEPSTGWRCLGLGWLKIEKTTAGRAAPTWQVAIVEPNRHGAFIALPNDMVCRLSDGRIDEVFRVMGAVPGGTKAAPYFQRHFIEPVDLRTVVL